MIPFNHTLPIFNFSTWNSSRRIRTMGLLLTSLFKAAGRTITPSARVCHMLRVRFFSIRLFMLSGPGTESSFISLRTTCRSI
ncbi:hypothetical protein BpHYR1_027511 [Brachionus plicatilis]|uniref:Uncharacterized protein n=1 Tax=Brachionus plicatilis TaxID=10195 RepID=A0A3M7RYT8_BRAPC|nr:hypothetical protein BpHYR1_027511 [Brachionus plicatilis]